MREKRRGVFLPAAPTHQSNDRKHSKKGEQVLLGVEWKRRILIPLFPLRIPFSLIIEAVYVGSGRVPSFERLMGEVLNDMLYLLNESSSLFGSPMFEELLDNVVAENIGHQAVGLGGDLREDRALLSRRGSLKLLLDEPGAVLILRELNHVTSQVTQLNGWVTIVSTTDMKD
jgi:hypothetical protein